MGLALKGLINDFLVLVHFHVSRKKNVPKIQNKGRSKLKHLRFFKVEFTLIKATLDWVLFSHFFQFVKY